MIGCHSIVKCRFEAQQRYASTVTPIINFQFSILNFPFMKFSIYEVFHLRSFPFKKSVPKERYDLALYSPNVKK